jgi:septum site-determining protein MinD
MGLVFVIASGKGGVGKSTIAANCGVNLSLLGKSVILIDTDCGLRSLDFLLGVSNKVVFDINDVISGKCELQKAIVECDKFPNLSLLPASQSLLYNYIPAEMMKKLCKQLSYYYDYVIVDSPAGIGESFKSAAAAASMAIVVATPDIICVKDAGRVGSILTSMGLKNIRLIINKIKPKLIKKGLMSNLDDVIDEASIRLIGIVPDDEEITIATCQGKIPTGKKVISRQAFRNIAKRLTGEYVPLMKL